ncbi:MULTISPECIES: hypothetical protein [Nocardioides]|uniref:Excreted virulence factor EspC, type VII ESX diderm n=1 Tax=Nocardioides lianchengensis TaxID=1045774 RepID=A0A1G6MYK6_9ACTN|nr:hypothetical protein [Nocardioides lianchengensis]NYG10593.1 hypothetical protein [Nocardioides lianchengensis]SDC60632.1 hypothetical protein SAMN05421872_10377 [Nocardioides lianchengensis]
MADTGTELGVDCYELWNAGNSLYPTMAAEFDSAAESIDSTSVEWAFNRDASIGLGANGPFAIWSACANMLDDRLAETGRNLRDTGTALVLAANTYAASDEAARAEFEKRKAELG